MASIRKEITIDTSIAEAWDALRAWGAVHQRLARGFVTDTRVEGGDRVVKFYNGNVLRERIVTVDDESRLLVWSIVGWPYDHHNASAQVFTDGDGKVTFAWIADLLPDEFAEETEQAMELGLAAIKDTLEHATVGEPLSAA